MICEILVSVTKYHSAILQPLFISGFTISSFLFSMKATIITTLKKDVYDTDEHKKQIEQRIKHGVDITYYESLESFSNLLMKAIYLSFASSILNISLGFVSHWITALICLSATLFSWWFLLKAMIQVQSNWKTALKYAEKKVKKERDTNFDTNSNKES
ncbi:hypothetical protein [Paraglaciecola sp.]|uniref:hypothetical protein n=1 Tax=Paraglaciecola sp. TaxID=1920173 RepID=UPI003266ECA2